MLAAENGHKDIVLTLTQKGADLDVVNKVSVNVNMLYDRGSISKNKLQILFLKQTISCFTIIIKIENCPL